MKDPETILQDYENGNISDFKKQVKKLNKSELLLLAEYMTFNAELGHDGFKVLRWCFE